jgi:preprotein translocase subunit SecE
MSEEKQDKKEKKEKRRKDKGEPRERHALIEKFIDYKAEFRKIVWPSRETLIKHTITTIVISLIFGAFIALTDFVFGYIFNNAVGRFLL